MIIDLHCHPSLKTYLFDKDFGTDDKYFTGGIWNPLVMQCDIPKMKRAGIKAVFSSIYTLEKELLNDCEPLKFIAGLYSAFDSKIKFLTNSNYYDATLAILKDIENEINEAKNDVVVVKTLNEYELAFKNNKIAIIHAIEGSHVLDNSSNKFANVFQILDDYYNRGVRMITIAHMYNNNYVESVGGIPDSMKIFNWFKNSKQHEGGLSAIGSELIRKMIDLKMAIDLTHCPVKARNDIYAVAKELKAKDPILLFTHVGFRDKNNIHPMSPDENEVKIVSDFGGIIGVIFMNSWLKNKDLYNHKKDIGYPLLSETIQK